MTEKVYSIEKDLKEADAMAKALSNYVLQDSLYSTVGSGGLFSGSGMPSMTIGALLMRIRRLNLLRDRMNASQQQRVDEIVQRNEAVVKEWRNHYEGKLLREANSRLDAMAQFFEECASTPRSCASNYGPEASRRTIVQELLLVMNDLKIQAETLEQKARFTDNKLRRYVQPGDFIWAAELRDIYPQKEFWWLYGQPHA